MRINVPVKQVGEIIGGHVKINIDLGAQGGFKNACPIRMSYVLNRTGFMIPKNPRYKMVSGADGHQYIYRVADLRAYLEQIFGNPDKTVRFPKEADFATMKGLILIQGSGWDNAGGHTTLWDGTRCADSCHLLNDPDNGRFNPETGVIWQLD